MESFHCWPIRVLNRRQQQLEEELREQVLIEGNEGRVDGATSSFQNSTLGTRLIFRMGVMLGVG
ncbi:hypothetical protein LR48_Vigan2306s000100 [Vigna angularis]|nr:hypothetical protein LR48_Vigan2306s000100 [Vigna angularis]